MPVCRPRHKVLAHLPEFLSWLSLAPPASEVLAAALVRVRVCEAQQATASSEATGTACLGARAAGALEGAEAWGLVSCGAASRTDEAGIQGDKPAIAD